MADKKTTPKKTSNITYTVARTNDGTVQVNFVLPYEIVDKKREQVLTDLGKNITVPGFRKGNAPLAKVAGHVPQDTVIQRTLSQILPEEVGKVIREEKLKPALYPKFELIKALDDEPWEVRATTCELPSVELGDYKKKIKGASKSSEIWTPEKGAPDKKDTENTEAKAREKEHVAIESLLKEIPVTIPRLLIEEEVNAKLSQLLERIEKLGLNLDSYLSSTGKNPQALRKEYEDQATSTIALDLILSEIAKEEKISVDEKEVDAALSASKIDEDMAKKAENQEQRRIVSSILTRRKALEYVISLV